MIFDREVWDCTCSFISLVMLTLTREKLRKRTNHGEKSLDYITRLKATSSGLKKGIENHTFWSEVGSGFWEPCSTPHPKCWGVPPPSSPPGMAHDSFYKVQTEPKWVSGTMLGVIDQSIAKCQYKVLYGARASIAHSVHLSEPHKNCYLSSIQTS